MTIQMESNKQHAPSVIQFIKVVLTFQCVGEILKSNHSNERVLFITLYKMVPTFETADEILKCDHSNESY